MIYVRDEITGFQLFQRFQHHSLTLGETLFYMVFVKPFKNLVIGVASYLSRFINKSVMYGCINRKELHICAKVIKDVVETLNLPR